MPVYTACGLLENPQPLIQSLGQLDAEKTMVYLAGSLMEGFGNESSDIDVYVIGYDLPVIAEMGVTPQSFVCNETNLVHNFILESVRIDVEYWTWGEFEKSVQLLNGLDFNTERYIERLSDKQYDLLHRFKHGKPIFNAGRFEKMYHNTNFDNLGYYRVVVETEYYQGLMEDLHGAYTAEDWGTAFFLARSFLERMATSFLASHGETNPSYKWLYRKMLRYQEQTEDFELLHKYMELQSLPYDARTVRSNIKKMIQFGQSINDKAQARLKVKQTYV
jgi:predicted nucleotidyltransferase